MSERGEELTIRELWYDDSYEIIFLSQSPVSITMEITKHSSLVKRQLEVCKKEMMLLQSGHYRKLKFASNFNAHKVDWSIYRHDEES